MRSTILILFLLCFNLSAEETALSTLLQKNASYNDLHDTIKSDQNLNEGTTKLQKALELQQKLLDDPNARAKLYYEQNVDAAPCPHCPKYLDLVLAVNNIVEKIEDKKNIGLNNEKIIQLTKLKFLYYESKSELDSGQIVCSRYSKLMPRKEKELKDSKMSLMAERALALPNVESVQLYEGKDKEVHYFYQGEGSEADNIIEVVVRKDKTAIVRYYKYEAHDGLPNIGSAADSNLTVGKNKDDYVEFGPKVITENAVLVKDIQIGKIGSKTQITDSIKMSKTTELNFNDQKTKVEFVEDSGNKLLVLEGKNVNGGNKIGTAVVNYDFNLDPDSGLKLGSSVGTTLEGKEFKLDSIKKSQSFGLGLTDHNNEYFKVKAVLEERGINGYSASNKFKAGDGTVGSEFQLDKNGDKSVGVNLGNQGYLDRFGVKYTDTEIGGNKITASMGTTLGENNKLSTEYSKTTNGSSTYAAKFEKNISENTSLVLTYSNNSDTGNSANLVFQSKF